MATHPAQAQDPRAHRTGCARPAQAAGVHVLGQGRVAGVSRACRGRVAGPHNARLGNSTRPPRRPHPSFLFVCFFSKKIFTSESKRALGSGLDLKMCSASTFWIRFDLVHCSTCAWTLGRSRPLT